MHGEVFIKMTRTRTLFVSELRPEQRVVRLLVTYAQTQTSDIGHAKRFYVNVL